MRLTGASGAPRYGRGVPAHPFGGCSHAPRSIPDAVTGRWSELAGVKDGAEMLVEQRGQSRDGRTTVLRIREYNIRPDASAGQRTRRATARRRRSGARRRQGSVEGGKV